MGMDIGGTPVGGGSEIAVHMVDRDRMAVSRAVDSVPSHVDRVAGVGKGGSLKGPQDLQNGSRKEITTRGRPNSTVRALRLS